MTLETYLQSFFKEEKISLISHYPGLTLHRLRTDLKFEALSNGIDSEELFDSLYVPYKKNPFTIFFEKLKSDII